MKTAFTVSEEDKWKRNGLGEIVTKDNIDTYIPELDTDLARRELENLQNIQNKINETKGSWDDYNEKYKDGRKYLIDYARANNVLESSVDDVKNVNKKARDSAIAHNAALKQQTLSAKAANVAMKGLSIAGNMLAVWAISELITIPFKIAESFEEMYEKANESAQALNEQNDELEAYKNRINEIHEALADQDLSVEEATQKRQDLYAIQDELIEKYGSEAGAINTVTDAINGQANALDNLQKKAWKDWVTDIQGATIFGVNAIDKAKEYMETVRKTSILPTNTRYQRIFNDTDITDILDKLADTNGLERVVTDTTHNAIAYRAVGTPAERLKILQNFKAELEEELKKTFSDVENTEILNYTNYIAKQISAIEEDIETHQDTYQTYMEGYLAYESEYSGQYAQILNDRAKLENAHTQGDETAVENAKQSLVNSIQALTDVANENGEQYISDFVLTLYPDIILDVNKSDFISAYKDPNSGLSAQIKEALSGLQDLSIEEIVSLEASGQATEEQQKSIDKLTQSANAYGLELSDLINILNEFGLVQNRIDSDLSDMIFSKVGENSNELPKEVQDKIKVLSDNIKLKLIEELNRVQGSLNVSGLTSIIDKVSNEVTNSEDTDAFLSYTNSLGEAVTLTKDAFAEMFNIENSTDNPFDGLVDSAEEYLSVLDSLESRIKTVSSAMEEQAETGYISASTAKALVEQNKDYREALVYSEGGIKLNIEALKDKMRAENEAAIAEAEHTLQTIAKTKATAHDTAEAIRNAAAVRGVEIPTAGLNTIKKAQETWKQQDEIEKQVNDYLSALKGTNTKIDNIDKVDNNADNDIGANNYQPLISNNNIYDYLPGRIEDIQSYADTYSKELEQLQEQYANALEAQDFATAEALKTAIAERGANFRKVLGSDTARLRGEATAEITSLLLQSAPNLADVPFDEITSAMWLDAEKALDNQYTDIDKKNYRVYNRTIQRRDYFD